MALRIHVGTKNKAKLDAVEEILRDYPHLADAEVVGVEVSSGVAEQPLSMEEIVEGAICRAKAARQDADYGFGIEAGFFKVPKAKSGYMDITVCAIDDGSQVHMGLSSGFETPDPETMRLVIEEGLELSDAVVKTGYVSTKEGAKVGGVVDVLTRGYVDRKEFVKQGLRMALIHIDNFDA